MKDVRLSPLAAREIAATTAHYREEGGAALARRFNEALRGALTQLATQPGIGSRRYADALDIPALRTWPMARFPYLIVYLVQADRLDVVRLLHQTRDIPPLLQAPPPE